jgi:Tfp pilus assembly protein FimT
MRVVVELLSVGAALILGGLMGSNYQSWLYQQQVDQAVQELKAQIAEARQPARLTDAEMQLLQSCANQQIDDFSGQEASAPVIVFVAQELSGAKVVRFRTFIGARAILAEARLGSDYKCIRRNDG